MTILIYKFKKSLHKENIQLKWQCNAVMVAYSVVVIINVQNAVRTIKKIMIIASQFVNRTARVVSYQQFVINVRKDTLKKFKEYALL